jgi:F-type H+-transporting ATPase subunit gamma
LNSEVDEIRLLFTSFLSTSSYRITSKKFLNLELITGNEKHGNLDYIFEPDPESILSDLLPRFLVNILYTAITESFASEQVARMIAMSAASKNAEDLIKTLTLQYNKTRQANITKEISEIVTGAEALK